MVCCHILLWMLLPSAKCTPAPNPALPCASPHHFQKKVSTEWHVYRIYQTPQIVYNVLCAGGYGSCMYIYVCVNFMCV